MGHYKVRKLKVQSIKNLINKKGKPKPAKLEAAGKVERQKKKAASRFSLLSPISYIQLWYRITMIQD